MKNSTKIDPYGFREYDARWIYEKDINIEGIEELGKGLGTQIKIHTNKENPRVVVGHDYRSYSEEIKSSLKKGLIFTGCYVEDIGLSLSPMVYFAQFNLNTDAVAMVTASHNENGWTGVKMGIKKGLTHAPEEMKELKEITLNKKFTKGNGNEKQIDDFQQIYKNDLINKNKITKKIKAVVACGNGTAGIFAPDILRGIGCEVIELDCNLDWTFPKYARNLSEKHNGAKFIVDVKSTGLYSTDKILAKNNCNTLYWKTGHSHIKRKVNIENALAGFEKSGHFFFNEPLGYGYDDGINSAIQVCHLLDNQNKKMSEITNELPNTFQTPTMAPFCKDEEKYNIVDDLVKEIKQIKNNKTLIDGQEIKDILTVNGVRFSFDDGSWGLIRASSNKPSLVIVTESPTSDERKKRIFNFIDNLLQKTGKIGEYDQKI